MRDLRLKDFGWALAQLRERKCVRRVGWNRTGMWLGLHRPGDKEKMERPYIYIDPGKDMRIPWVASQVDMLAEDWVLVED